MITIEGLKKSYGNKKVLKNIDLTFRAGAITGIAGENGSGKTTLFRCVAGLEKHQGTIRYAGNSIKDTTGFLPTNPYFLSKMTGREYLRLMTNARQVRIDDLDHRNLFDLPLDQYADTYSTGMKKKLALTAILLQRNDIFILDEPFNGVDIQSNMVIREILVKLKELGKIIIISSHVFSLIGETCDVLHQIRDGEIIRSGGREMFALIEEDMKGAGIGQRVDDMLRDIS